MRKSEEQLMDPNDMSDHDLLIRVTTIVDLLLKGQENHLEHHRRRDLTMLSVTLGSLFTAMTAIICAVIAYLK
jgi:hypothetical protein